MQPSSRRIVESDTTEPDQWQVQIQTAIQKRCRVVMHTSHLSDADLAEVGLEQVGDVSAFVTDLLHELGPTATCCVLPEGPQTIPYIAAASQ